MKASDLGPCGKLVKTRHRQGIRRAQAAAIVVMTKTVRTANRLCSVFSSKLSLRDRVKPKIVITKQTSPVYATPVEENVKIEIIMSGAYRSLVYGAKGPRISRRKIAGADRGMPMRSAYHQAVTQCVQLRFVYCYCILFIHPACL